jgi:hypothetical protein
MKKLFLTLAFMLVAAFTYSNENANTTVKKIDDNVISIYNQVVNQNNSKSLLGDCTITIKDNQSGNSYTITIHGRSCSELIRELLQKAK